MAAKRSKKQMEQIKRARSKKAGRYVVRGSGSGMIAGKSVGRAVPKPRGYGGPAPAAKTREKDSQQPRPKLPLLSGGKDPTLAERFEEELYRS
jgi:hypothetical protein